jgi:hypothetical protein
MKVPVIADLVALGDDSPHELRPALGVRAENEKRRLHALLAECVEYARSRIGIGSVVKRQRDTRAIVWKVTENRSEQAAVAMKRAVSRSANHCQTNRGRDYHTVILLRPSTAV